MSFSHCRLETGRLQEDATGPEAESVHSALVSAVSKAKMIDLTESLALKSIQKALPTE